MRDRTRNKKLFILIPLFGSIIFLAILLTVKLGFDRTYQLYYAEKKHSFYDSPDKVWSHRGLTTNAQENSIEAFQQAIKVGAKGIELDVYYDAALNSFIVSHDEPYQKVDGVLLTLQEVLKSVPPHIFLWVDFKNLKKISVSSACDAADKFKALFNDGDRLSRAIIESENPENLAVIKDAGLATLYWVHINHRSFLKHWVDIQRLKYQISKYRFTAMSMDHRSWRPGFIEDFPQTDFYLFTVNDLEKAKEYGGYDAVKVILSDKAYFQE